MSFYEQLMQEHKDCQAFGYRWVECPECGAETKAEADATTTFCECCEEKVKIHSLI